MAAPGVRGTQVTVTYIDEVQDMNIQHSVKWVFDDVAAVKRAFASGQVRLHERVLVTTAGIGTLVWGVNEKPSDGLLLWLEEAYVAEAATFIETTEEMFVCTAPHEWVVFSVDRTTDEESLVNKP
jgi:hypothetical protein